ncbi:hypothetical protein HDU98_011566 [Podochytrium sp. JEL0797]|nr:hypothetical protein HDU98_011566 [Podochytrium sp. JEL0797]
MCASLFTIIAVATAAMGARINTSRIAARQSSDPFDISNSQFPGTCQFYLDTVASFAGESVYSGNSANDGYTPFSQYDCYDQTIDARCDDTQTSTLDWSGDATWVWNKAMDSTTDPYRYNVIWFMQLIGNSDDLFHECDDDPSAFDIAEFDTTPLNLQPDCITFGKWCRAWAGHVTTGTTIAIHGQEYSVEDAFLKLSSNRIKIDFMNEDISMSWLRQKLTLAHQMDIADQFATLTGGGGNCITDQHYCLDAHAILYEGANGHWSPHFSNQNIKEIVECTFTYETETSDTCGSIAARNSMSLSVFQSMNPTVSCGNDLPLPANQLVCVPGDSSESSTPPCLFSYTLQNGDTCDRVAQLFGLSPTDRLLMNPTLDCADTSAYVGQSLCLENASMGGPGKNVVRQIVPSSACSATALVSVNQTCVEVSSAYKVSVSQLGAMNTGMNCWNLGVGNQICVAIFTTTSTLLSAPATSTSTSTFTTATVALSTTADITTPSAVSTQDSTSQVATTTATAAQTVAPQTTQDVQAPPATATAQALPITQAIQAPPATQAAPASPKPPPASPPSNAGPPNPNDPFAFSNSQFPGQCSFYLDTVKSFAGKSVYSQNTANNGYTPFSQYNCYDNSINPRCDDTQTSMLDWSGDATWVWNKGIDSSTDPYRYNVIWFMQLIGDSDDLFHECDDNPSAFSLGNFGSTPLNLRPNCISFGKWCRAWAGFVSSGSSINIQGTSYSVEQAFLKLSSNRIKIDFKDETVDQSYLRSSVSLSEQQNIANQFATATGGGGNCITDQHYCMECNGDSNHCSVAQGCLFYSGYCP